MKLIAFAHLTITDSGVERADLPLGAPIRDYRGVLNPVEKMKTMFLKSARHSIQIKRGNFDFEFNVYELNTHQVPSTIENSILREFNNNSEIRSASFTPLFFQSLERILEIETKGRENFAKFRTLNPGKNLILKFDGNYPRFGKFLDLPGMASIAFYVTNLDTLKLDIANSEVTDAFFLELEESRYMIRFVRCGEVWVELIQRL